MTHLLTHYWKLALVWMLSLVAVGAVSSSVHAQRPASPPSRLPLGLLTEAPTVISGNDVGFRVERTRDGIPIGRIVVRVNGSWIDAELPAR
jgi:hypothetical protein